jgi:hypothetical protein
MSVSRSEGVIYSSQRHHALIKASCTVDSGQVVGNAEDGYIRNGKLVLPRVADQAHGLGPNQTTAFIGGYPGASKTIANPRRLPGGNHRPHTDHSHFHESPYGHLEPDNAMDGGLR